MTDAYSEFIKTKHVKPVTTGFNLPVEYISEQAKDWQRKVVKWSLNRGRAALFEDTGLGKTFQQLLWAEQVAGHTNGRVLLHCPIGVRQQTKNEATKFCIDCDVVIADDDTKLPSTGIVIVNYEKLHKFDTKKFTGVVLDESSILKSFTGSIKRKLCEEWQHTNFRLACTATPSPNDHMELGNHAQFLGIMNSNEMLSRWFFNDTMNAGGYKILPHGEADFWDWVATWAACVSMPSDIGGSDDGYILPKLTRFDHTVVPTDDEPDEGCLFRVERELTATTVHKEKRRTTIDRARKVAEIVESEPGEPWLIWCDTNYEADELMRVVRDCVDLRGNESETSKERKLAGFSDGTIRRMITKPTVAGFGLNWQHCRRMAFIGLSYSYEQYYQAVRRCWRFGQKSEVHAHVVMAESEAAILKTNERKQKQHTQMQQAMRESINRSHQLSAGADKSLNKFNATKQMELPRWLSKRK
jgi:superfamily II DNA or RNA helicase